MSEISTYLKNIIEIYAGIKHITTITTNIANLIKLADNQAFFNSITVISGQIPIRPGNAKKPGADIENQVGNKNRKWSRKEKDVIKKVQGVEV